MLGRKRRAAAWLSVGLALALGAWWLGHKLRQPSPAPVHPKAPASTTTPPGTAAIDAGAPAPERLLVEPPPPEEPPATTLAEQRAQLLRTLERGHGLSDRQIDEVAEIFTRGRWLGQGNPKVTQYAMSRAECRQRRHAAHTASGDARCGAKHMVPLFDPNRGQTADDARVCIDQFEFPNLPCEYPVVWVRASEVVQLCAAIGKRVCDAHEWEGACAGALRRPDEEYAWGKRRLQMEYLHNKDRQLVWSYGQHKDHSTCATGSRKSPGCYVPSWQKCGSNTYPAGSFPRCVSPLGVYDLHGNAAEHMNLPLKPEQLASRGGTGQTEMKGSWFIFDRYEAHPDDCRWRARNWHGTRLTSPSSHNNYHLGFRCCKDLGEAG